MYSILFVTFLFASALGAVCPPDGSPWYFIPHETDCSKFYICAHGVPVLQNCPNGTHFSAMHMVCQNPFLAGCDSSFPELCPDWSLRPRPYPDSCSKFYICTYGDIQVFDCPQGLEFNAELLDCVWPAESNCSLSLAQESPQTDESQEETVQNVGNQDGGIQNGGCQQGDLSPHEECSKYYVCDNGVEVAMDCPAGLQWNSGESQCVWPEESNCGQQTTPEDSADASQDENAQNGSQDGGSQDGSQDGESQDGCHQGDLSPNEDCSKYNICVNGAVVAADCPAGLHWNSELLFCDWPVSAGCKN